MQLFPVTGQLYPLPNSPKRDQLHQTEQTNSMSKKRKPFRSTTKSSPRYNPLDVPCRRYFTDGGHLLIGMNKGIHADKLPLTWIEWAMKTIEGFGDEFALHYSRERAKKAKQPVKAAPVHRGDVAAPSPSRSPIKPFNAGEWLGKLSKETQRIILDTIPLLVTMTPHKAIVGPVINDDQPPWSLS
jgi:hypothetical protein